MGQWYGSINNRIMEHSKGETPTVGMGVTQCLWSDRVPWEIIEVQDDRHLLIRRLGHRRIDDNGFSECQEYEYFQVEDAPVYRLFKDKNGRWVQRVGRNGVDRSSGWYVGKAEYYYDFTF